MKEFKFNEDLISFLSIILTILALILSFLSPEKVKPYLPTLITILFILLLIYLSYSFKKQIEYHSTKINKINEKINIYKDISELKSKLDFLMKMEKRGSIDLTEVVIRLIQIGAIIFATIIIFKILGTLV